MHENTTPPVPTNKRRAFVTIVFAWLVAGTLDITAASLYYPLAFRFRLILLYQNIASGVLGDKAFSGGAMTAALGLAFHFAIALVWTIVFFLIYPRILARLRNVFAVAVTYGILVWFVMNLIVLPLSRVNHAPFYFGRELIAASFLVLCIGLPLSFIIGRYYSNQ